MLCKAEKKRINSVANNASPSIVLRKDSKYNDNKQLQLVEFCTPFVPPPPNFFSFWAMEMTTVSKLF